MEDLLPNGRADASVHIGTHLIADLWGTRYLDDVGRIEAAVRAAVAACGASLIAAHFRALTPGNGVS